MWRIKTPPGEKRKEVKKAQCEEKVPLKVSYYKERESTKWGHKRKKRVRASQLWQLSMGSELWWAVTAEKSRRGELFAGWDLHPVEFKPAGEVLNQTSQHLKIHISISKRPFDKVRSDLSPCSSCDRHIFLSVNLIFRYKCEKQMELRKVFSVKFMTPLWGCELKVLF